MAEQPARSRQILFERLVSSPEPQVAEQPVRSQRILVESLVLSREALRRSSEQNQN